MTRVTLIMMSIALMSTGAGARPRSSLAPGEHNEVINGVRLWYRVAGQPIGVPVVFVHGGPGEGSQSFETIAGPGLERTLRVVYLDQRGSGRSERPWNDAYSIPLLVDDLEKLRQRWGVSKLDLVGHSAGTIIEMEYGARYPSHVRRMVLAASGPDLGSAFELMCQRVRKSDPGAYERAHAAVQPGSKRSCNMWADGVFGRGGMQAFVDGNMFPFPATKKRVNDADRANGLRNTGELSSALIKQGLLDYRFAHPERLTMPVMVIAGDRDFQAAIEPQREFVKQLPNGKLSEWRNHGHFMWAEDPDRFDRQVAAFLRE